MKTFVPQAYRVPLITLASMLVASCGGGQGELEPPASDASQTDILSQSVAAPSTVRKSGSVTGAAIKWHPGHYVYVHRTASDSYVQTALQDVAGLTNFRGLAKIYSWPDLESSYGKYTFATMDRDLAAAKAAGRRLIVILDTKSTDSTKVRASPDYLRSAAYEGGVFPTLINGKPSTGSDAKTGESLKLWNSAVKTRLAALVQAMGARYNADPAFEAIVFNETAMGQPARGALTAAQMDGYYGNLAAIDTTARTAFRNTVVIQMANFPRDRLPALSQNLQTIKGGIGGPDTFLNDPGLTLVATPYEPQGAYLYYPQYSGQWPVLTTVSRESYFTTYYLGPLNPPSPSALLGYARDTMRANYMLWQRNEDPPVYGWSTTLAMFRAGQVSRDAAGGLARACPSSFGTCQTD